MVNLFSLAEHVAVLARKNGAKKLNVRYVPKNPADTAKTQNRVPKLKEQKNPVLQHSKPCPKTQRRENPVLQH